MNSRPFIDFSIGGIEELRAAFDMLPQAVAKSVMVGALKEGAKPVAQRAKELVPVRSGGLQRSITISTQLTRGQKRALRRSKTEAYVYVGPSYRLGARGRHGHLLEFGTAPHMNKGRFAGTMNPGIRPHPFMRPAWDQTHEEVLNIIRGILWEKLKGAARSLAKRAAKGTLSKSSRRALGGW